MVTTSELFIDLLDKSFLAVGEIQLLLVDQCHLALDSTSSVAKALKEVTSAHSKPRLLGLTTSLLDNKVKCTEPSELEAQISLLEAATKCRVETASDILSILR